jgi:hypothetical protein
LRKTLQTRVDDRKNKQKETTIFPFPFPWNPNIPKTPNE